MNAVAAPGDSPILPLRRGGVEQSRIPSQWHGDPPPIPQGNGQLIARAFHICEALVSCQCRDAHAMPPTTLPDVEQ